MQDSLDLAKRVKTYIDDKLGENIICLDLRGVSTVTDFLVISTGKADTHVKAIAEGMLEELKKEGVTALATEGLSSGTWACIDYADVIVHIMRRNERETYNLEAIWGGAAKV